MLLLSLTLLIMCSYTDLKERIINLALLGTFLASALILLASVLMFGVRYESLRKCLVYEPSAANILYGLIPGIILFIVCRVSKEAIGKGDVYVIMILGVMLGFEKTFILLFLSMVLTAVYGLICMAWGSRNRKDSLPYIPFVLCAFTAMLILSRIPLSGK